MARTRTVNVREAKAHLSRLLQEVERGGDVVIAKAGRPIARLVSVTRLRRRRKLGWLAGRLGVPDDFDAPLPKDLMEAFEGKRRARPR